MPAACFAAWNNATGALTSPVATNATSATSGTVKTLLQIQTGTGNPIRVLEWGYSFDIAPANNVRMELIETGSIAATVTAHVAAGIHKVNVPTGVSSSVTLGTSATGYNATAEGTITATRLFDYHYENGLYYSRLYPLGREWEIPAGNVLRIRATPTAAVATNVSCYVIWEE